MKLFLSSLTILPAHAKHFFDLVSKDPADIRFALIENAADVESGDKHWVEDFRQAQINIGLNPEVVDLTKYLDDNENIEKDFADYDVIYLGGGNTFYLRWLLDKTGMDDVIRKHVAQGKVYGGSSAGAIIVGPTLSHVELADDITKVDTPIIEGLRIIDEVVVPHFESEEYGEIIEKLDNRLVADGYTTIPITDHQAVIISDSDLNVVQ